MNKEDPRSKREIEIHHEHDARTDNDKRDAMERNGFLDGHRLSQGQAEGDVRAVMQV